MENKYKLASSVEDILEALLETLKKEKIDPTNCFLFKFQENTYEIKIVQHEKKVSEDALK